MARKIRNQCDKKTKTAQQIRRKRVTKIVYLRSINIGITQGKDKKKISRREGHVDRRGIIVSGR